MRYISNQQSATEFIRTRTPFTGSSMRGETTPGYTTGRLPLAWGDTYLGMRRIIDYVVYSFQTPIAWHTTDNVWVIPHVTYSGYTSRHQGYALNAARIDSDFDVYKRLEADRYYNTIELMRAYRGIVNGEKVLLHTNRQYAHVTIRGIRSGDYVQSTTYNSWRPVHNLQRVRGVLNHRYWRALIINADKSQEWVYIGNHTERIGRLR